MGKKDFTLSGQQCIILKVFLQYFSYNGSGWRLKKGQKH